MQDQTSVTIWTYAKVSVQLTNQPKEVWGQLEYDIMYILYEFDAR